MFEKKIFLFHPHLLTKSCSSPLSIGDVDSDPSARWVTIRVTISLNCTPKVGRLILCCLFIVRVLVTHLVTHLSHGSLSESPINTGLKAKIVSK